MNNKSASAAQPNVLVVTVDQWPGTFLGCAGHPDIQKPTLDAPAIMQASAANNGRVDLDGEYRERFHRRLPELVEPRDKGRLPQLAAGAGPAFAGTARALSNGGSPRRRHSRT